MFSGYRISKRYRKLDGCTYCDGAIYVSRSPGEEKVIKCFHCGRMFKYEEGHLVLWPFREYPHLEGRQVFRVQQRFSPQGEMMKSSR